MNKCKCGGVLEFVYHVMYRCRDCGRWECEEQTPVTNPTPVPFLSREVVRPKPHAHGREKSS